MQTYTVLPGDTLFGIGKQFGVSAEEIRRVNNLSSNSIIVGQVLMIPTLDSTITYTVKSGDNLYDIARLYGTTVNDIMSLNNLSSNALSIGQTLLIPVSSSNSNGSNNGSDYINYTVKSGDNLYDIARLYGTTVNDIMSLNNLSSNALSIGQTLLIPVSGSNSNGSNNGSDYINYTVKSGDNLYDIARLYGTTVNDIMSLNNLTSNFLSIGQILKIPTGNNQSIGPNYITYIVRRGDSLYSIARKFDMTVDELIGLNNLKSNVLNIGQSLKVKGAEFQIPIEIKECFGMGYSEPTYQTYTVKSGDSLYIIAKKFNTSVDNLVLLNNLSSNNLQIGQVLKIKEIV